MSREKHTMVTFSYIQMMSLPLCSLITGSSLLILSDPG